MKIDVAHYKPMNSKDYIVGGRLELSKENVVLKLLSRTAAVFSRSSLRLTELADEFYFKTIQLSDGVSDYILLLMPSEYGVLQRALESVGYV